MDTSFEFTVERNENGSPRVVSVRLRRNITNMDRFFSFRMMQEALAVHVIETIRRFYPFWDADYIRGRITGL